MVRQHKDFSQKQNTWNSRNNSITVAVGKSKIRRLQNKLKLNLWVLQTSSIIVAFYYFRKKMYFINLCSM